MRNGQCQHYIPWALLFSISSPPSCGGWVKLAGYQYVVVPPGPTKQFKRSGGVDPRIAASVRPSTARLPQKAARLASRPARNAFGERRKTMDARRARAGRPLTCRRREALTSQHLNSCRWYDPPPSTTRTRTRQNHIRHLESAMRRRRVLEAGLPSRRRHERHGAALPRRYSQPVTVSLNSSKSRDVPRALLSNRRSLVEAGPWGRRPAQARG